MIIIKIIIMIIITVMTSCVLKSAKTSASRF